MEGDGVRAFTRVLSVCCSWHIGRVSTHSVTPPVLPRLRRYVHTLTLEEYDCVWYVCTSVPHEELLLYYICCGSFVLTDPMAKRTRVAVKILEGKNLLVSDLLTGTSDPIALLWVGSCGEGEVDLKYDKRVQVQRRSCNQHECRVSEIWQTPHVRLYSCKPDRFWFGKCHSRLPQRMELKTKHRAWAAMESVQRLSHARAGGRFPLPHGWIDCARYQIVYPF